MTTELISPMVSAIAAATSFIAAGCWYKASVSEVLAENDRGVGAMVDGGLVVDINGRHVDLHETLSLQAKWNRRGALYAAAAALCAGVVALIDVLS